MAKRFFIILFIVFCVLAYTVYEAVSVQDRFIDNSSYIKSNSILKFLPQTKFTKFEDGTEVSLPEFNITKSKKLFIHFWATWCGPCEVEFPQIVKLVNELKKTNEYEFIFVIVNDTDKNVQKFFKKNSFDLEGIHFLKDDDFKYKKDFGTHKLPETYVFSKDNELIKRFVGPQKWEDRQFYDYLKSLK